MRNIIKEGKYKKRSRFQLMNWKRINLLSNMFNSEKYKLTSCYKLHSINSLKWKLQKNCKQLYPRHCLLYANSLPSVNISRLPPTVFPKLFSAKMRLLLSTKFPKLSKLLSHFIFLLLRKKSSINYSLFLRAVNNVYFLIKFNIVELF